MKRILLFGAGKSATVLIRYLIHLVQRQNWQLEVVDANLSSVQQKLNNAENTTAVSFDITGNELRKQWIEQADLVISLLPPALHILVAKDCIQHKKNLLTASYVDEDLKKLEPGIEKAGVLFLCEMGLDPGIDHMSAKKMIDGIHAEGANITSFISHCGGLVAPESDDNPWHYKISWNPRNVVLAGKAGAVYKQHGVLKKLSYPELFSEKRYVAVEGLEPFCWYPNRDSLPYLQLYDLHNCDTFIRTTLRHPLFIEGWKNIIDLQLTDKTMQYPTHGKSLKQLLQTHFDKHHLIVDPDKLPAQLHFLFSGIGDDEITFGKEKCSVADVLQYALEKKLALGEHDKDMVVMKHEIEFQQNGKTYKQNSTLVVKGEDGLQTAMAKTVGLPLGIAARLILKGVINCKGLHIPISKKIYEPVLAELEQNEITFSETKEELQ